MKRIAGYLYLVAMLFTLGISAQVENNSVILDWRQHNLNKYNRMLVNPGYSIAREQGKALSFWSRIQWTGVTNAPQTFLLNYSGKVGEHSGAGMGLYQQNLGLLTDSGLLLNYAYEIQFAEKVYLTFGLNSTLFRRSINQNVLSASDPDPVILENQDDFLWLFMPGFNLSIGKLDLGVYAENLFDYNLNESRSVTNFQGKIYSGHLALNHRFLNSYGLLRDALVRGLVYGKTQPNELNQFGGNLMLDLPRTGWLQMGYNNTYGLNGVLGIKLSEGMSVAITYESGTTMNNSNFGPTYEAMATIELGNGRGSNRITENIPVKKEHDSGIAEKTPATSETSPRDSEESEAAVASSSEYAIIGSAEPSESETSEQDASVADLQDEGSEAGEVQNIYNTADEAIVNTIINDMQEGDADAETSVKALKSDNFDPAGDAALEDARLMAEALGFVASATDELAELPETEVAEMDMPEGDSEIVEVPETTKGKSEAYRTLVAEEGIEKGFYLVVNVFAEKRYFNEFTKSLKSKGLEPLHFWNPKNKYWYVYLAYADNYYRAKTLQRNHYNGQYRDEKWVLWVK